MTSHGENSKSLSKAVTPARRGGANEEGVDITSQLPNSSYNSLPRHYSSHLRPPQSAFGGLEGREAPHSDTEQVHHRPDVERDEVTASPYGKYGQKYGSLPSKGRLKKDAAQNLLDYCDALLADLEKAAAS